MSTKLETAKLAEMLKKKRGSRGLREVAKNITNTIGEISTSTLSRIEQGNLPDIVTYITICQWLEVSPNYFTQDNNKEESVKQAIVTHLRADKNLPAETSDALIKMITLAYESLDNSLQIENGKK